MKERMERIEKIRRHPLYISAVSQINEAEKERIYCRHTEQHFLDVARIMYIRKLEQGLEISKEMIYAAALLHDIGRARQYTMGIEHDEAGVVMAEEILPECGFAADEIGVITYAVGDHRKKTGIEGENGEEASLKAPQEALADLLREADNLSRACYSCAAEDTCKWSQERKNLSISL